MGGVDPFSKIAVRVDTAPPPLLLPPLTTVRVLDVFFELVDTT